MPVKGANNSDWNNQSFWYEPWGKSGVHKGIDIFANKGTALLSSSVGLVIYSGEVALGGKVVLVLGSKWRFHYYAHLDSVTTSSMSLVRSGDKIGTVGDSGNAKGKPPHLHYSIITPIPYLWRIDSDSQGWKKMFFLDPNEKLRER
ncbi:MAG: peptidase M23 [Kangiella sp.]|nr:MAG: peptidase M23 [Kangiella sp.]